MVYEIWHYQFAKLKIAGICDVISGSLVDGAAL
jgi:hypothetical protein